MFLTFFHPLACIHLCAHQSAITHVHIHTFLQNTLDCRIICNCEYICFSHRKTPTDFVCLVRLCAHVLCMYLSLGRCPLTWPVTGQTLRTLPYCTPQRGLETGHQRLKGVEEEEYRRGEEAERAEEREGVGRERWTDEVKGRKGGGKRMGREERGGMGERGSKVT